MRSGFDTLGQQARQDFRVGTDAKPYTPEQALEVIQNLEDYKLGQQAEQGHSLSWAAIAGRVGMPASTLSELRSAILEGKPTKLDRDKYLRLIDGFLGNEAARGGRLEARDFVKLSPTEKLLGVYKAAVRHNTMGVIIGPPGCGKSITARAIAAEHQGAAAYCRINEGFGNARGVSMILCEALRLPVSSRHPQRFAAIMAYVRRHRNMLIVIDESQKLECGGLELLRDIYDGSDPEGKRCVPMLFFGDAGFMRLITKARSGATCAVRPQLTRRMAPFFNMETDGASDGSGQVFSPEDIQRVLRNSRVKLISDQGAKWLAYLANVPGFGSIGFAVMAARMAADITTRRPLAPEDLQRALKMLLGPRVTEEVDQLAGGQLLRAAV